jgi:2-keto-4-pentenoate hydratase/2-oxohepta-3-ene-1,7-dioic acid hydratase in catechol pathway/DNA-binding transcriptional LysR family regulator
MIPRNLRHFRLFLDVADGHGVTGAARRLGVTQPAVTQALASLERAAGAPLFDRTPQGLFPTDRGAALALRLRRAMGPLDAALASLSPRLLHTATAAQLRALIAVAEAQNVTLAAAASGRAQPTLHRAITRLEAEASTPLFERTSLGLVPTRACSTLVRAARLAFSEVAQAEADLAEFDGQGAGRITLGALPLSRAAVLPEALAAFHAERPRQIVTVIDGSYPELLSGLRQGDIDLILGALRDPPPVEDVVEERLFTDRLVILARRGHPATRARQTRADLLHHAFAVPRPGTPSRAQFDAHFGTLPPAGVVECGSVLLMRELLQRSDLLGCISGRQAEAEIRAGLLAEVATEIDWPERPIGLTLRAGWRPTRAQARFLDHLRRAAAGAGPARPVALPPTQTTKFRGGGPMPDHVIPAPPQPVIPTADGGSFPVRRVYCIGRNFAAHAVEMGHDPDREPPFFFQKTPDSLDPSGQFPYPTMTSDVHHEVELLVALKSGGTDIPLETALDHVWGYGICLDMTRRDLQGEAKNLGRPWEIGKSFERSGPVGPLLPVTQIGHPSDGRISLTVNGEVRQDGDLNQMIWKVPEMIAYLSRYFTLAPGDVIMAGTPAGVGPVAKGDVMEAAIDGLGTLTVTVV